MNQQQIDSLLNPACYPDHTCQVQHLQTHISHIFLVDQLVYKIKKPVDFGFLDFTSLEKRLHYCNEELRLNRRLSPDIYLEVVALYDDGAGGLCFSVKGEPQEYAVKMRRMPQQRMMSVLLDTGSVSHAEIEQIAKVVTNFHAEAASSPQISAFGSLSAIRSNWEENLRQVEPYLGRTISQPGYHLIASSVRLMLDRQCELFEARVQGGYIRECDGDLHSENICLDGQVHIFDCIEFNERFRYSDTAADVAFLAMDLEFHGYRDLASYFVSQYMQMSGDEGLVAVLPLYLANRAFIRGKVESFRLDDRLIPDREKGAAALRAARYFRLAQGYLLRDKLPQTLFMTCGLTGCGKSAIARELSFQLGITHLASDRIRKELAGIEQTVRGADIYSRQWNQATYRRMAELAAVELDAGRSLLVDATFRRPSDREPFVRLAAERSVRLVILQPECPPDLIQDRLMAREQAGNDSSDGTWEIYQRQLTDFVPPSSDEGQLIRLDATATPESLVETVLQEVGLM